MSFIPSSILVQDVSLRASKYPVQPTMTQSAMKELQVCFYVIQLTPSIIMLSYHNYLSATQICLYLSFLDGLGVGYIVGIVIVIAVIGLMIVGAYILWHRREYLI